MKKYMKKSLCLVLALIMALGMMMPQPVQASTVRLSKTSLELYTGYSKILMLKNADNVKWSTSDKSVAKVSANGIVTGVDKGNCIVYAYDKDTQKSYSCKVKVLRKSFSLHISRPESMFFHIGGGMFSYTTLKNYIKSTLGDTIAADVEWSTSDKDILYTIDNQALRAAKYGDVVLTAKMRGRTYIYDVTISPIEEDEKEKDTEKDKEKDKEEKNEEKEK